MKKKLFSLFLSMLLLLTAVPLAAFGTVAAEDAPVPTGEEASYDYASLYVDGAYALLMAYNNDASVDLKQNGSGTWKNKVADPTGDYDVFDLVGALGPINDAVKIFYTPKTNQTAPLVSFYGVTFDADGNPMYGAVSTLTREVIPDGGATEYSGSRSINHFQLVYGANASRAKLFNITRQDYAVYLFIADESRTTYVYEKTYYSMVGSFEGTAQWQIYTEKPTSGDYTEVVNYVFTEDLNSIPRNTEYKTFKGYFDANSGYITGGWQKKNGGIGVTLNDAFYNTLNGNAKYQHYLHLGAEYIPDDEYTIELIASIDSGVADTDGSPMTQQSYFICEGDGEWSNSFRIGPVSIWSRAASTARFIPSQTSAMYSTYTVYNATGSGNNDQRPQGSGDLQMKGNSAINNISFTKTATSEAHDNYTYAFIRNGSTVQSFTTGSTKYSQGEATLPYYPEASGTSEDLWLLRNVSSTMYSVRVYPFVLSSEQKAQNHFADLCAYFALDMTGFDTLGENDRKALYTAFSAFDFTANKTTLQTAISNAIAGATPAPGNTDPLAGAIVFDGFTLKLDTTNAIRTFYTVDDAIIAQLEEDGYRVRYGALVGLGNYLGEDFRELSTLTLDAETLAVTGEYAYAVTVYDTQNAAGTTLCYTSIDEEAGKKTYSMTITYEDGQQDADYYKAALVSRAFLALTDENGETTIHYIDATDKTFEEKNSFGDVAAYYVNQYVGPDSYKMHMNETYRSIMAMCEIDVAKRIYANPPSVKNDVLAAMPGLVAWGDSLSAGAGGNGTTYETALESFIRRDITEYLKVVNMGVGGETSATIAGRATAKGHEFVIAETVTIPANTVSVEIKLKSADGMTVKPMVQGSKGINNVIINGVEGTITAVNNTPTVLGGNADMTYTFTRVQYGAVTECPVGTVIETEGGRQYADYFPIVFIGQNGGWNSHEHLYQQQMAIVGDRTEYIILGLTSQTAAYRKGMEDFMTEKHGDHYINLRAKLSDKAWLEEMSDFLDLDITFSAQDIADCEVGKVPACLLADAVHLNAKGYTLIGYLIYDRMLELNYFAEVEKAIEDFEY